jgi:hypothetical protein
MATATGGVILFALVLSLVVAAVVVVAYNRIRLHRPERPDFAGRTAAGPNLATDSPAERRASPAAEMMQAIVRREMAADPAFKGQSIDFGTAPDGSLEIWIGEKLYQGVEQIPDESLRRVIARAAEEFNRGSPAPR